MGEGQVCDCHYCGVHGENELDSWFVHDKLVLGLLTPTERDSLWRRLKGDSPNPLAAVARVDALERVLVQYLRSHDIGSVDIAVLEGNLQTGQVTWVEQEIAFRGLREALVSIRRTGQGRASFSARLASNKSVRIWGDYNASRLTCSTARVELSGTRRQFLLGYVKDVTPDAVELRPITIASRWFSPPPHIGGWLPLEPGYLWPGAVDQLADVDFRQRMSKADLELLKEISEVDVKRAFAEILGEPEVPNDWGGEQFDLWTTRLFVDGQPLRAAFVFKGPSEFRPMTIATLGKNGDQIDRLARTAADVLVVQHCHVIRAEVTNMLRIYASDPRHPRRYLIFDGYDTVKVLRHFGYLT